MRGRSVPLSPALAHALAEVFDPAALREVDIREHVGWLRPMPWIAAITGPGRIWLRGSADDFFADPGFVLHEYCHVLQQWAPGRLSALRYVMESARSGYRRNRFEIEARAFAAAELPRVTRRLAEARRLAEDRLALVEPPRDPGEQHAQRQTRAG